METARRRQDLRAALIAAAERAIEREGLRALRARALADEVDCAVGAIYNVFADLDDLVLAVNARTLEALESAIKDVEQGARIGSADDAIDRLVRLALAYLDFAAAHTLRWRAIFDHRLPPGRDIPDWYMTEQRRLFDHVDPPLRELYRAASPERRALLTRSLFSAVHGVVVLGLEEKLQVLPVSVLREQLTFVVATLGRGLAAMR